MADRVEEVIPLIFTTSPPAQWLNQANRPRWICRDGMVWLDNLTTYTLQSRPAHYRRPSRRTLFVTTLTYFSGIVPLRSTV
jgi:hypothetical protein